MSKQATFEIKGELYELASYGKKYFDGSRHATIRRVNTETCPNGHVATDRLTDGMPIPCLTLSCTYYRRPIAPIAPKAKGKKQ